MVMILSHLRDLFSKFYWINCYDEKTCTLTISHYFTCKLKFLPLGVKVIKFDMYSNYNFPVKIYRQLLHI
jgi:hypothetical protein